VYFGVNRQKNVDSKRRSGGDLAKGFPGNKERPELSLVRILKRKKGGGEGDFGEESSWEKV